MEDEQVLPAYAGMIPQSHTIRISLYGAPRIRGDDPGIARLASRQARCSPHTRG